MQYLYGILYTIPGAVIAITVHEYIKALVSMRLGDPLPKKRGRLTLNPIKHMEPIGFLFMVFYSFGWGQPVETASMYYRDRKQGTLITYITPSLINIMIGLIFAFLLYIYKTVFIMNTDIYAETGIGFKLFKIAGAIYRVIYGIARCNLTLAFFNIVPIYPLDGAKVLGLYLSPRHVVAMSSMQKLLQLLLLLLIFLGVAGAVINPIVNMLLRFVHI